MTTTLHLPPFPNPASPASLLVAYEARERWMVHALRAILDEHSQGAAQRARAMVGEALAQILEGPRPRTP